MMIQNKIFCRTCRRNTNHKVIENENARMSVVEELPNLKGTDLKRGNIHHITQCCGCDTITFIQEYKYQKIEEDKVIWKSNYHVYPATFEELDKLQLRKPMAENVPSNIFMLFSEVIFAYTSKMNLLCSVGLRMIVEAICIDKSIQGKDLFSRIESLKSSRIVTETQGNILHQIRKLGNDTAHQILFHEEELLKKAIDVIQVMLFNIYSLGSIEVYSKS